MAPALRDPAGSAGGRTPAQWYCLLAGAALLLAGLLGWIADATFDTGADVGGDELVVFEVNGWHNLVQGLLDDTVLGLIPVNAADDVLHIALGLAGVLAALASPNDQPLATTTAPATATRTPPEPGA